MENLVTGRGLGKTIHALQSFILMVKSGRKVILFGKEYVVMDMKTYKSLTNKSTIEIKSID